MNKTESIRVLVADDHPVVCMGLAAIIGAQVDMSVVAQAADGVDAIQQFRKHRPDVTLMDLRMPKLSGVDAIRAIREEFPGSVFVVLTTYQGDEDIHRALMAGAQAYLLKGMPHADLLAVIRRVHAGLRYLPDTVLQSLANRPPGSDLTARELEILKLIVRGLSNRQIAGTLGITESTVKWHVNAILARLNVTDRTQAAVAALQRGIVELVTGNN
jgi:two-component system, NarL family, response regulator